MKMIIATVSPFLFEQNIYYFENDDLRKQILVPFGDVPKTIVSLASEEQVTDIKITGGLDFGERTRDSIKKYELSKFGHNTLNIEII